MKKDDINSKEYQTVNQLINEITKKDKEFYRLNTNLNEEKYINKIDNINTRKTTIYSSTSNQNYINTYNQLLNNPIPNRNKFMISPSPNLLSQIILGEKYIITKQNLTLGYKLIKTKNGINLYKNTNSLPIGYATNNIISLKDFKELQYPNNTIQLLTNIVINNKEKKKISTLNQQKLKYTILEKNNLKINQENNTINIKANKNATLKIKLDNNMNNKILFLSFQNKKLDYLMNLIVHLFHLILLHSMLLLVASHIWFYHLLFLFSYCINPSSYLLSNQSIFIGTIII